MEQYHGNSATALINKAIYPLDGGGLTDLTREVNSIPNTFGKITQMGLFKSESIATTTFRIDVTSDRLAMLPQIERIGPLTETKQEIRNTINLSMPYYGVKDYLTPEDLQDVRAPGTIGPDTANRKRAKKMMKLRRMHALTQEHMMVTALQGDVKDGNGKSVLNLHTLFGVKPAVASIDFKADTKGLVKNAILDIKRYIELNTFTGDTIEEYGVLCSPEFFDGLTTSLDVRDAYQHFSSTQNVLRNDLRMKGFRYAGLNFIEYNTSVRKSDGTTGKFLENAGTDAIAAGNDDANHNVTNPGTDIAADDQTKDVVAYVFPMGVADDMYLKVFAPINHMNYVNTMGQEIYTFEYVDPRGQYVEMSAMSACLPICTRPQALVKVVGKA